MTTEQRERFEAHQELASRVAGHWAQSYHGEYEALYQAALIGLWQAALKWSADAGASFPSWAWTKMRAAVMDYLREHYHPRRPHVLDLAVSLEALSDTSGDDLGCLAVQGEEWRADLRDEVNVLLGRLKPAVRRRVEAVHLEGVPQSEIAVRDNCTTGAVCKAVSLALDRLRGSGRVPRTDAIEKSRRAAAVRLGVSYEEYQQRLEAGQKRCPRCQAWKPRLIFSGQAQCPPCRQRIKGVQGDGRARRVASRMGIPVEEYKAMTGQGLKRCPRCCVWLPRANFGAVGSCRPCFAAYQRERKRQRAGAAG